MTVSPSDHLSRIDGSWASDAAWQRKLDADSRSIVALLPSGLRDLHDTVTERGRTGGAAALILSGSTARGQRTEISDLDYHLIGPEISVKDLSRELDLHTVSETGLADEIRAGDDFVQWSVRFGLIVFDEGAVRDAHRLIAMHYQWPDLERKRAHAAKSVDLARRFVETGDEDGALEQVRTALSLAARAYLLALGEFPLSRAELPGQLEANGQLAAAAALAATIFSSSSLQELSDTVRQAELLVRGCADTGKPGINIRSTRRVPA